MVALPAAAVELDAPQNLEPDRHGRIMDIVPKVFGAMLAVASGWVAARISARDGVHGR